MSHLLLSIFVLLHLSCGCAINSVPPGLNNRRDLWSIIVLHITDLVDSPALLVHPIGPSLSKKCLVVILCSSSSRLTSCLSSRAWLYRWPLCRWAWASQPSPPSPPPLVSSPSPPCWPLKPSWPRRRKRLVTEWTATARRTERSPISCRSRSDTSDLSPHFAYSVTVTTHPRPAVSHWEHFDLVTVLWLLYLLLFNGVSCFLLFILSHLLSLSVPACLPLARSLSLHLIALCHLSTCYFSRSKLLSGKAQIETGIWGSCKTPQTQFWTSKAHK